MPIVYVDAPSSNRWVAQVNVRVAENAQNVAAGLTVYDLDGERPDLLLAFDRWPTRAGAAGSVSALRYSELGLTSTIKTKSLAGIFGGRADGEPDVQGAVSWIALKVERTASGRYSLSYNTWPSFEEWQAPDDVEDSDYKVRQRVFSKTMGEHWHDRNSFDTEWVTLGDEILSNVEGRRIGLFVMTGEEGGGAKFDDFFVKDRFPMSVATYRLDDATVREAVDPYLPLGEVISAAATQGRDGYLTGGMLFNSAAANATLPADPFADVTIDFTISVWIKPHSLQSSSILGRQLFGMMTPSFELTDTGGFRFSTVDGYGMVHNETYETPSSLPDAPVGPTSARPTITKVLEPHVWTHLAVVKQGDTLRLFRNAEVWSFSKYVAEKMLYGGPAKFLMNVLPATPFHGALDDLRFYDVSLSRMAVGHLYTNADPEVPRAKTQRCVAGQACNFVGMSGEHLSDSNQLAVLAQCGKQPNVVGFPNTGSQSAVTSNGGLHFNFSTLDNLQTTSAGGKYQLCWCSGGLDGDCVKAEDYKVLLGNLIMVGPYAGQQRTCTSGQVALFDIMGVELSSGDRVQVLDTCGSSDKVAGLPQAGTTNINASKCVGHIGLGVDGGLHIHGSGVTGKTQSECCGLCERSLYQDCEVWVYRPSDRSCFLYWKVDSFSRQQDRVLGIVKEWRASSPSIVVTTLTSSRQNAGSVGPFKLYVCRSQDECRDDTFVELKDLDGKVKAYQSFDVNINWPPRWWWTGIRIVADTADDWYVHSIAVSAHGLSRNFTIDGWIETGARMYVTSDPVIQYSFGSTWGIEAVSLVPGGIYHLCWCADLHSCDSTEDFRIDIGQLPLMGPAPLVQPNLCERAAMCIWRHCWK
jgi:hypothetical protein